MLTLKAPIQIKSRTDFVHDSLSFHERITGNYSLLGMEIGSEELLHMVTTPPEIYVMEGEMTTVSGNTVLNSRNEEKLNVVNNVLNRILLSVDTPLTYQDRTYISDVLYKMGIRDDRKFMNEVRRVIDDSRLQNRFIDNYFQQSFDENAVDIRQETLRMSRDIVEKGLAEGFRVKENYLGKEIMQRLQTGAIYQIVANFSRSVYDNRIEGDQYHISEQENTARQILVESFLNTMEREGAEIIYREEEAPYAGEEGVSESYERIRERELSDSIRERERYERESSVQREYREEVTRNEERVIPGADRIFREEGKEGVPQGEESLSREEFLTRETYERESKRDRELLRELSEEREIREERIERERRETGPGEIIYREEGAGEEETPASGEKPQGTFDAGTERERIERQREYIRELALRSGGEGEEAAGRERILSRPEMVYREEDKDRELSEEDRASIVNDLRSSISYRSGNIYERELTEEENIKNTTEEISAAVFIDIIRNLYNSGYERIRQGDSWFDIRNALYRSSENTFNRVSFRAESSEYNTFGGGYEETENVDIDYLTVSEEEPAETAEGETEIFERQLKRINEQNINNYERYQQMMSILKGIDRKAERREGGSGKTRSDALKILEGNEDIRLLFNEEDEEREERRDRVFHEVQRLFPDNTREVFSIIEKYMASPGMAPEGVNIINNNLAQAAEEIRRFQERERVPGEPVTEDVYREAGQLIHRRNETLTQEEIEEAVANINRNSRSLRENRTEDEVTRETVTEVRRNVRNMENTLTVRDRDEIAGMVSQGVRSQMNAISEQVLQKLEKRLRNEKSRRGI